MIKISDNFDSLTKNIIYNNESIYSFSSESKIHNISDNALIIFEVDLEKKQKYITIISIVNNAPVIYKVIMNKYIKFLFDDDLKEINKIIINDRNDLNKAVVYDYSTGKVVSAPYSYITYINDSKVFHVEYHILFDGQIINLKGSLNAHGKLIDSKLMINDTLLYVVDEDNLEESISNQEENIIRQLYNNEKLILHKNQKSSN